MCSNFFLGKSNALGEPLLKVIWQNIASVYDEAGMGRGGGEEMEGVSESRLTLLWSLDFLHHVRKPGKSEC